MTIQPVQPKRKLPVGAEVQPGGGVHFRVWAPKSSSVKVQLRTDGKTQPEHELAPDGDGYFSGTIAEAKVGQHYRFVLDS